MPNDILPDPSATWNLGLPTKLWNTLYTLNLVATYLQMTGSSTIGTIKPNVDNTDDLGTVTKRYHKLYAVELATFNVAGSIFPTQSSAFYLGNSSLRWAQAFIDALTSGSITPLVASTFNLGSSTYHWLNAYIDTLYIYATTKVTNLNADQVDSRHVEYQIITLASAATEISFTGLAGNTVKKYRLICNLKGYPTGASSIYFMVNGNETLNNYNQQTCTFDGTTVSGSRGTDPTISYLNPNEPALIVIEVVRNVSGYAQWTGYSCKGLAASIMQYSKLGTMNVTISEITALKIQASNANGFVAGSSVILEVIY